MPASFPTIITVLKVNVGLAWVGVDHGGVSRRQRRHRLLDYIWFPSIYFTLVLLGLFVIAILATIMFQLVDILERKPVINSKKESPSLITLLNKEEDTLLVFTFDG
ncbi:hypothetical protein QYF49_24380 [Fictibacillus sp. CENA-BCM004]|uniref:Uncharacterized protein n=1 Tax=Fictibacillus terranigra TaxID=3058424 RepID=A0ABT8EDS2_9BACL|nr:hypothetical protein [Fictibacillus sp. CENA-BCM004]MDN4076080.1 hypothetical protein [Fictibacillus sp. CENA-BCM004]